MTPHGILTLFGLGFALIVGGALGFLAGWIARSVWGRP